MSNGAAVFQSRLTDPHPGPRAATRLRGAAIGAWHPETQPTPEATAASRSIRPDRGALQLCRGARSQLRGQLRLDPRVRIDGLARQLHRPRSYRPHYGAGHTIGRVARLAYRPHRWGTPDSCEPYCGCREIRRSGKHLRAGQRRAGRSHDEPRRIPGTGTPFRHARSSPDACRDWELRRAPSSRFLRAGAWRSGPAAEN